MSVVKNRSKEQERELRFLHRAIIGLIFILGLFAVAVWRMPNQLVVYTAPDISKSFIQKNGEVPLTTVYGFARTLWESLNYCEKDCGSEYLKQLDAYSAYLTNNCRRELKNHFDRNRHLYAYRNRQMLPTENAMYSNDKIKQMSGDSWYVRLEYLVRDDVGGIETRNNIIEYPLKIVRSSRPIAVNPLGLEADCYFGGGPVLLEKGKPEEIKP